MTLLKQRKAIIIAAVSLFVLFGAGIGYYLLSPSSMIAIDVNPSIEIHTNRLGEVVSIDPVNDDAVQLMAGYQLTDKNLENVIHDIVDRMLLNGYLVNDDTDAILLSADQNSNSDALLDQVKTAFSDYLQEKQVDVALIDQKVDMNDENVEEAHANSVSVGKMALIDKLTAYSSDTTATDFTGYTVKELVQYAINHNISMGDLMRNYHAATAGRAVQTSVTAQTVTADAVTSATVTPTPEALPDDTTITISTGKDSKMEDANDDSDIEDANENDSDIEDASDDQKDNDKEYVKESSKTVKSREDANDDDSQEADSKDEDSAKKAYHKAYVNKEDSTDAVSGATINSDKEDSNISEDNNDNEDEDNYLKEDNEDNNFQGKEDQNQDEDSQGENEGGYRQGDEGDDD